MEENSRKIALYMEELPFANENELLLYMRCNPKEVRLRNRQLEFECATQLKPHFVFFIIEMILINIALTIALTIYFKDFTCLYALISSVVGAFLFFNPARRLVGYIALILCVCIMVKTNASAEWFTIVTTMVASAIGMRWFSSKVKELSGQWLSENLSAFWELWEASSVAISYSKEIYLHSPLNNKVYELDAIDKEYKEKFVGSYHPYTKKEISSAQDYLEAILSQKAKKNIGFERILSIDEINAKFKEIYSDYQNQDTGEAITSARSYLEALNVQEKHKSNASQNSGISSSVMPEQQNRKIEAPVSDATSKDFEYCRKCGAKILKDSRFCNVCGEKVEKVTD